MFVALNRPDARDTDIEAVRDTIVDSLFSVFVTLGKLTERDGTHYHTATNSFQTLPKINCNYSSSNIFRGLLAFYWAFFDFIMS